MSMPRHVREFIAGALDEDAGIGDLTSEILIPEAHRSTALFIAKENFTLAGLPFAALVFAQVDETARFKTLQQEGSSVKKSSVIAEVEGNTRSLLLGERVALNILQRLSGIATLTNKFVLAVKGLGVKILDTRKTTPGMRYMEKYAVRTGGGMNHRFGLYDGILIKDNHIAAVGDIREAVLGAKAGAGHLMRVEVEAESLKDIKEALRAGADVIMLDNMSVKDVREAVKLARGKAKLEVSGGMSLEGVREIAETGVDYISIGALTHSAPAVDISMKIVN